MSATELFAFVIIPIALIVGGGILLLVHNWASDREYARLNGRGKKVAGSPSPKG